MSGIVFFKSKDLRMIRDFYQDKLGLKLWLDQGKCMIFEHRGMLIGFCQSEVAESQGTITFLYDSIALVDAAYLRYQDLATSPAKLNPAFNIYHFWAEDPEGRTLEFQYFLKAGEQNPGQDVIEVLNEDPAKPKLLLTRLLPEKAMNELKDFFEVHANIAHRNLSKTELIAHIADKAALLCLLGDDIDESLMNAAAKLKVISNYAVGYNNIDLQAAKARGIAVCNTPGVLTESTADLAWALIMATARRIPESESFTREGNFVGWEPLLFLGQDVHQRTLGILGMGRIGQAVARRARGFDMKVIYHSPHDKELDFAAERVDFETLLLESDILSLHLPLKPETKHLIGEKELKTMKRSAILINTARGAIVDERVLIRALQEGWIFAAGFDVYEHEPEIPQALKELPNAVLLPHIGSASLETREQMGSLAARNAIAIVQGTEAPARVV
jgi:glyoxylate reductase